MEKVKLKDLGEICTGNTPSKKNKEFYKSNDICFFKPSDIDEYNIKLLNNSEEYISEMARNKARILPKGTILVTCIGTIGKIGILEKESACNQQINAIIPNNRIDGKYLAYLIYSKKMYLQKKANAPVVPIINKTDFSNIELDIYDKSSQIKIANELDKVQEIIDIRKKQIEELDELIKSQFVEMFEKNNNFEKILVSQAIEKQYIEKPLDGNHGSKHPKSSDYVESGVPFIMANNLKNGCIDLVNCNFITKKQADSLDKGFAKDGDVLITHKGTIGETAIVHTNYEYVMLTPQITYYRPNTKYILPEYLKAYFDSELFQLNMKKIASAGSTRAYIGITEQRKLNLIVPPMELQQQYSDFVKQVDKQKFEIQKSLEEIQLLQESLMNKYFGEI